MLDDHKRANKEHILMIIKGSLCFFFHKKRMLLILIRIPFLKKDDISETIYIKKNCVDFDFAPQK